MSSGSLLIRDVEVQAAACLEGCHQGLQLPGRGARWTMRSTSDAARSRGKSQACVARSACGQDGANGVRVVSVPPLSVAGFRSRSRNIPRRVINGPGSPAEAERAGDQGLVAADRDVGADLEVGPAQLVPDLLAALLGGQGTASTG